MNYIIKTFIALYLISTSSSYAQNFSGEATYQTQRSIDIKLDSTSGFSSDMQKSIQEQLRKQFQKEYILTFNKDESLWKEEGGLNKPQAPTSSGIQIQVTGNSDILYTNVENETFVNQADLMGKLFLVSDSLKKQKWQLEKEIKNIGNYVCFKATLTEEYDSKMYNSESGITEIEKKTKITTAWYTLDIPLPLGPDNYWGLPGLILEVNDGKKSLMCTKIVLKPSENIAIEIPHKGKKVNAYEYEAINEKKAKEFMDRYQKRGSKKGDSSNISISIQG